MAGKPRRVKAKPGSELASLLEETASAPVILEKDGVRYRLSREEREDIWAAYDPEAARTGIRAAAGTWNDIDTEAFKAFIYRAREEGTTRPGSL